MRASPESAPDVSALRRAAAVSGDKDAVFPKQMTTADPRGVPNQHTALQASYSRPKHWANRGEGTHTGHSAGTL